MCAHAAKAAALQARERRESFDYDAFISYAHEDRAVAAGIQKGLHGIVKLFGNGCGAVDVSGLGGER